MRKLFALFAALLLALPPAHAQEQPLYTQAELDQMLAPVALYPDVLLSQVLMAATYPLEVVEAARWSRAHPGLTGDEAVRAAADRAWDPSVKSLLAFPQLLTRMDEQLDWTRQLGEAFLAQEGELMDAVQRLRQKAKAAGRLLADERVRVVDDGSTVVIEYANPRVVYVPYYDPWVVYGGWWWPAYPPVAWAPWPGYAVVRSGFWWGAGVGVSVGFFFGAVDWPHRYVKVVHAHNHYVRPYAHPHAPRPLQVGKWQHQPQVRSTQHRHYGRLARPMPPALSASPHPRFTATTPRFTAPTPRATAPTPRFTAPTPRFTTGTRETAPRAAPRERAVPYDRSHGSPGRTVDRPDRGRGARADAPQHRAAQPHGFARDAGRHPGPVSVRPAFRAGVAGDRPRMGR